MSASFLRLRCQINRFFMLILILGLAACNLSVQPDNVAGQFTGAPVVMIAAPLPDASFMAGVNINIQASITNAGPDIHRVEIALDDRILTELAQPNPEGEPAFTVSEAWVAEGAGSHIITVTAIRADGTPSAPATVTINVLGEGESTGQDNPTSIPTTTESGSTTNPPLPTPIVTAIPAVNTPVPQAQNTQVPAASATPSVPMATFTTGINVRRGPDLVFNPPLGQVAPNDSSEILAVNSAGTWYKIRYYNSEGWVYGPLITLSGNTSQLPIDNGPPVPTLTPVPPTAIPPSPVPQANVNLVAGNIRTEPDMRVCRETFNIYIDVANFGTERSPSGNIAVVDMAAGGNSTTEGAFGPIEPGQTVNIGPIPLTVSVNYNEQHTLRITLDPHNLIPETNKGDNTREITYTLEQGSC